jgi:2-phosphoglycolate phosphatase
MIRAVLFDFDGTLADTAPDLGYALNLQLQRYGREPIPTEVMRPHSSAGARGLLKLGFGVTPEDENFSDLRSEYLDLYENNLCRNTVLFPGVVELLNSLEMLAIPWGIVTNKPHRFTVPLIKQLGLSDRANCVVSGDSVPRPKPYPDSLLKASEEMGIKPEDAIYVGDDERDVQAANAARMRSVVAGYGYLGIGNHPEDWGAQGIITNPSEVLNFL